LNLGGAYFTKKGDTLIAYEEMKKNKKLTEYEDVRDFVIANSVKKTRQNRKSKDNEQDRILDEF
jgi:hypothetical protein